MRLLLAFVLLALAAAPRAQDLNPALAPLAGLIGQWEGEARAQTQTGPKVMIQTEDVRAELGGQIILVEGMGREMGEDGEVVFNAFGVFSVDAQTGEVWFDAFTHEGRHTRVQPTFTEDGFEWGLEPEMGPKIHYTMRFDEQGRWVETGRVSMDGGENWLDFFEMTLSRVDSQAGGH